MMRETAGRSPREFVSIDSLANLVTVFKQGDTGKAALLTMAEECAKNMPREVKTHQLRNLLNMTIKVRQMHTETRKAVLSDESRGRLATLRPRVAYMAARRKELKPMQKRIDELLRDADAFKIGDDVDRLYEFVEALVAFHKYYNPNNE